MTGRPVRLLTAAALVAAASLLTASAASANCYSGCGYAAPVTYSAPVVYSYSYAAPVSYAAPCGNPCGYSSYGYASPMYVVNQGPAFDAPVIGVPEPAPTFDYGYRRAYPYIGGGVRWHHRHWNRGYGYRHRGYGYRSYGYRDYGYRRFGYRGFGYRDGYRTFRHGLRYGMRHHMGPGFMHRPRHPMVGPGGIYRGSRDGFAMPRRMGGGQMHIMRQPGTVHPRMGGQGRRPGQP